MTEPAMPTFFGEPDYAHGSESRLGVLFVNLGTPDAADAAAVRRFLAEFLWDPRVVEAPRWLWWLALNGVVLRIRPSKSAHAYRQIWTPQGSPLLVHSRALAQAVQAKLAPASGSVVALGMSYGQPSIPNALHQLQQSGARRLLILPLYPQYSATTTASVFDRVTKELRRWRWIPEVRFVTSYAAEPRYVEAIADSIREHWRMRRKTHLLFSFHGIPRRYLLAGDPYHCQCQKTARCVAAALRLAPSEWSVSFQSQVGREEWLKPYTDEWLIEAAQQGRKQVTVVCPGFATDCLETLEEIAIRNRESFFEHGGDYFDYVPALNATAEHVELMSALVERHTRGWEEPTAMDELERSRQAALQMGAAR